MKTRPMNAAGMGFEALFAPPTNPKVARMGLVVKPEGGYKLCALDRYGMETRYHGSTIQRLTPALAGMVFGASVVCLVYEAHQVKRVAQSMVQQWNNFIKTENKEESSNENQSE